MLEKLNNNPSKYFTYEEKNPEKDPVSYTHLTLPTICSV